MVKATDLIKQQKDRDEKKKITYKKILEKVEKKIVLASNSNFYECKYDIPEFILGLPIYSVKNCKKFIKEKLRNDGFKVNNIMDNILLISWYPN